MFSSHDCPLANGKSLLSFLLKFLALDYWANSSQGGRTLENGLEAGLTADVEPEFS